MKKSYVFIFVTAVALSVSQVCQGQAHKNVKENEANRLAREGAEAAKSQDLDKAVELLRKASAMDHKYADELSDVYQRRGYTFAKNQQYREAIQDYGEAIKIEPKNPRIYEQRAAVEMKIQDYGNALADYAELIKLKPNEVRYYNYRAYIYEAKEDPKNSMTETENALKVDANNQEAKERKQRLERKEAEKMPTPPPNTPAPKKSPPAKKKP